MHTHIRPPTLTYECVHTQTSLNLSDTHMCMLMTRAQNTQNKHERNAQTQSKCPHKVDEPHSVSN